MIRSKQSLVILISLFAWFSAVSAEELPSRVGECSTTRIKSLGTRLQEQTASGLRNVPGSGSALDFENGESQVSYDTVPQIEASRPGDPVRMCLVSIPSGCPKGDYRGREYRVTNLRTHQTWSLPNSEHLCGGA